MAIVKITLKSSLFHNFLTDNCLNKDDLPTPEVPSKIC